MTSEQLTESQAPPFFSIVIPSYNNAGYLRKCILSLQKQNFSEWEAVIVIDASPIMPFMLPVSFLKWIRELRLSIRKRMKGRILQEKVE